jgi:hypothetical protein
MRMLGTEAAMVAALLTGVSTARAQSAVLSSPPDSAELRELRVAVADGPASSTIWFGARLEGAADDVFVVVPAPPGSAVDLSTDAWFESLEDATNTRVRPPSEPPENPCAAAQVPGPGDVDSVGDAAHVASVDPSLPAEVLSFSELVLWAQGKALNLSFDAMSTFADLDVSGYRFVMLHYEVPPGTVTLATVRVASTQALVKVPLVVTSAGASPADVHVWTFTSGRASPGQLPWTTIDPADVQWQLAGGIPPTNYRDVLASTLSAGGGASWVVDAAAHTSIFRSTAISGGASPIPSLVEGYFERASGYGDALSDPTACVARVASLESSQATVAGACASGAVAQLTGDSCAESPQPGQIDPDDLRCGGIADDLALAMSGAPPEQRWLSRWTGRIAPWTARAQETLDTLVGGAQSPVVVCGAWDASVCEADAGTGGAGGSGGSGGAGGSGGGGVPPNAGGNGYGGGSSPYDPPTDDPYYDDGYYDNHTDVYVEGSCWGDTSTTTTSGDTQDDSCSGDSSSSSSDEESCSGDSSSSASEDDSCAGDSSDSSSGSDSCSGDSSDSSDGGDACSGDTSDSSSGADTCAGDSSSGSSSAGDSCSGGSSSGSSSSDCSVSGKRRGKGGRLPTSAFAMLIVASGLAARRLRKAEEKRVPFR